MYQILQQKEKDLNDLQQSLNKQRSKYIAASNATEKQKMTPSILDQEKESKNYIRK